MKIMTFTSSGDFRSWLAENHAEGIICGLPASVRLCGFHLLQPGGSHFSGFDKAFSMPGVILRLPAFRSSWCEFLKPRLFVIWPLLSVNPSEAKRLIKCFCVCPRGGT